MNAADRLDAEEARPAHVVAVAFDAFVDADRARSAALAALIDANRAVDRADAAHLTAFQAYQAALAADVRS